MGRKKGERKAGSWRDKGQGECFTRTNKSGGSYVVCDDPPRGSKGQKGVYKTKTQKKQKEDVGTQVKLKKVDKINKEIDKLEQKNEEINKERGKQLRLLKAEKDKLKKKDKDKLSNEEKHKLARKVFNVKSVVAKKDRMTDNKDKISKLKEERRAVKKN